MPTNQTVQVGPLTAGIVESRNLALLKPFKPAGSPLVEAALQKHRITVVFSKQRLRGGKLVLTPEEFADLIDALADMSDIHTDSFGGAPDAGQAV